MDDENIIRVFRQGNTLLSVAQLEKQIDDQFRSYLTGMLKLHTSDYLELVEFIIAHTTLNERRCFVEAVNESYRHLAELVGKRIV